MGTTDAEKRGKSPSDVNPAGLKYRKKVLRAREITTGWCAILLPSPSGGFATL